MKLNLDKKKIRMHFDRHSHEYDQYASVQRVMSERLLRRVLELRLPETPRHIVEIGCGTGLLTRQLLAVFPHARVTALDLSPQMAEITRQRCRAEASRLQVIAADAEQVLGESEVQSALAASGPADLILSSAVFQWFNEPLSTLRLWQQRLAPQGMLAFATFGPDTFQELHGAYRRAEKVLGLPQERHGQAFLSLADWQQILEEPSPDNGTGGSFTGTEELLREHFADVRSFLYSVKRVGAGNATAADRQGEERRNGGSSRRLLLEMEKQYKEHYEQAKEIPATYHVLYGIYMRSNKQT